MLRLLAFLLAFPALATAQTLPAPLSDTISDYADLLTPDQESALTDRLQAARDVTGVHIHIATMGRIADYGGDGQSIESYGKKLFNHWGIGDATRNDGILILVASDDREMRIALGAGYDPVYDGLAQRVIDRDMLPAFRAGDYAGGITAGVESAITRLAQPFAAHETPQPVADEPLGTDVWLIFAGFGAMFLGILGLILRPFLGDMAARFRNCPQCGTRGLHRHRDVLNAATTALAGHGQQITRCGNCSYEHNEPYVIPIRSKDSSGGSSGFGGGGSSGGGASGKW